MGPINSIMEVEQEEVVTIMEAIIITEVIVTTIITGATMGIAVEDTKIAVVVGIPITKLHITTTIAEGETRA